MRLRRSVVVLVLAVLVVSPAAAGKGGRTYIDPRSADDAEALPFSGAVLVGDTLYLSGTLGLDENGKVPEDPAAEARIALDAIAGRLKKAGMTMDDLVFVQVFCSDVKHYAIFNGVYRGYFDKEFPARAFIGSGTLLRGARFEVQAIAVKR